VKVKSFTKRDQKVKNKITTLIVGLLFAILIGQGTSFKASFKTAQMFERKGDYNAAISIYTDLYSKNINDQRVFRSLINVYKKSEKLQEGITFFETLYQSNPLNLQIGLTLFEFYYLGGHKLLAETTLSKLEAQFGHLEPFYRGILQIYMNEGLEKEILSLARRVRQQFHPTLFSQELGYYYQARRVYDRAMDEYILYLSQNKDRGYYISKRILKMSDEPESISIIDKKLTQSSHIHDRIIFILADFYFKQQQYQKAFQLHVQLGAITPKDMSRWFKFANQLQKELAYSHSIHAFEIILKNSQDSHMRGQALIGLGKSFEAQITPTSYTNIIDYYYNDNLFLDTPMRSITHITNSHLNSSIAFYDSVLTGHSFSNQSAQAYYRLGEIHYHVNQDFDRAFSQYQSSLKNHPNQNLKKTLQLRIADTYLAKGDPQKAFRYIDSLFVNQQSSDVENKRILMAFHTLPLDTVMDFIESAFTHINPTSSSFNDLMELRELIQIHFIKGSEMDKEAFQLFVKADLKIRQSRLMEAIETINYLQEIFQNSSIYPLAVFRKSLVLNHLSKSKLALESLELLKDTFIEDRAIILTGQIYELNQSNIHNALKSYHRILDEFPESIYFQPVRYHIRTLEEKIKS